MLPQSVEYRQFSAEVRLELRVGGQVFRLASIGPSEIVFREPTDLQACDGEVVMLVDGAETRWPVRLDNGAVPFDREAYISSRGEIVRAGRHRKP